MPLRVVAKPIREPSGDHCGLSSSPGEFTSCRTFDPSTSITKMSQSPSRLELNANRRPSGDQLG